MGRSIEPEHNTFLQLLLKLIPSEVIAVHVFIQGVMPRTLLPSLVVSLLLVTITPAYLRWAMGVRSRVQLLVSTGSLIVWIYALGQGPFRFLRPPWYEPWYGSVLLALWTLVPPMVLKAQEERDGPAASDGTRLSRAKGQQRRGARR